MPRGRRQGDCPGGALSIRSLRISFIFHFSPNVISIAMILDIISVCPESESQSSESKEKHHQCKPQTSTEVDEENILGRVWPKQES